MDNNYAGIGTMNTVAEPLWRLVAVLEGREVPATATIGGDDYTLPQVFTLQDGMTYAAEIRYELNGRYYCSDTVEVTSVWKGVKEHRVTLRMMNSHTNSVQTVDLGDWVHLDLLWCPPGTFLMGSPKSEPYRRDNETQHLVTLTKGFWMGKTQVTPRQWEAVMGSTPPHCEYGGLDVPVQCVTWDECQSFIRKVNECVPGGGFRLPTEAEWEYAARGGRESQGYFYSGGEDLDAVAWYIDNSNCARCPVGLKRANELGIHDMGGNVRELCADWDGDYLTDMFGDAWPWCTDRRGANSFVGVTDPPGPQSGSRRICRGGSYSDSPEACRPAARHATMPHHPTSGVGLRLARDFAAP